MITEFKVAGWWRKNEASGAASALLSRDDAGDEFLDDWHINVKAETAEGIVKIISDDDLTEEQVAKLRDYFENHPEQDMPQWERDKLVAEKLRQEELVSRVRKFTDGSEISMNVKDIRDALAAVAELMGLDVEIAE